MKKIKAFFSTLCIFIMLSTLLVPNVQAEKVITSLQSGTHNGYDYMLWKTVGDTSMTLLNDGIFSCQWSDTNDVFFRMGKRFNGTQTHQQLGNITLNYNCVYQPDGDSYLAVYGRTKDPTIEYYIIESWDSWEPPPKNSLRGTIDVDDGTYEIYLTMSPRSLVQYWQFWSIRTSKRTSGTVSVSEHFKAWELVGPKMGNITELSLGIEGYKSRGSATVSSLSIDMSSVRSKCIQGDINGDLEVNSLDYALLRRYVLDIEATFPMLLSGDELIVADLNGDNKINSTDCILLKRYILGLIDVFPNDTE